MLRRIKWAEDPSGMGGAAGGAGDGDSDESGDSDASDDEAAAPAAGPAVGPGSLKSQTLATKTNRCVLVWEGSVKQPAFRKFRLVTFPMEHEARDFLRQSRVEHYWDIAKNHVEKDY